MKALIFAAGRGTRMRPLTDATPKPLLEVGGKPLIAWHLEHLRAAGVREVIINTAHLAGQFPATFGDGRAWGLDIRYLREPEGALETGGGLLNALPLLGPEPFLILSGDIFCDLDLTTLPDAPAGDAHLVLVDNPPHHPHGDFGLDDAGAVQAANHGQALTFAGIAVCRAALLNDWRSVIGNKPGAAETPPRFRLAPLLHAATKRGALSGQHHRGHWTDVGTPERLAALDQTLRQA